MNSPDCNTSAFLEAKPDALRYENLSLDEEDAGMKIASFITPGSRILDVGCGTGVITELLMRQTKARIVGIEPDGSRVQRGQQRGLEIYQGLLTHEFIQQQGLFDYVVFADVLEHLPNPAELVEIAKTALKPGGAMIVSVPNVAHWFVRQDLLRGRFDYTDCGIMDATHLRWFTKKNLIAFFERLGFRVQDYASTVNINLWDYHHRKPWKWLKPTLRRKLVGKLVRLFPTLFGCQHVIKATLTNGDRAMDPCS